MFETWLDVAVGSLWGFWLALYLDRLYSKQVAAINLCAFVFWGKSFKANRMMATLVNVLLVASFLLLVSSLIGNAVESWGAFVAAWCVGFAVYSLCFSAPKQVVRRRV